MFIAYTDASVKNNKAILAFVIVFEDKRTIHRRMVVDESDNNIAEALAISELLSFLKYYNFKRGLILLDSNVVKRQLKKKGRIIHKYLPKDTKGTLRNLQIRTQVIPRKCNVAHRVCYYNRVFKSSPIRTINRGYYESVDGFPELYLRLSAFEEYRQLFNKRFATFHEAQMKLNKKIWLADLVEEIGENRIYEIHDKRIYVLRDTIIKISKQNYVRISNHWKVFRRRKKLEKMLKGEGCE